MHVLLTLVWLVDTDVLGHGLLRPLGGRTSVTTTILIVRNVARTAEVLVAVAVVALAVDVTFESDLFLPDCVTAEEDLITSLPIRDADMVAARPGRTSVLRTVIPSRPFRLMPHSWD